jgi:excinuclease ABC subunit C
MAESDLKSQYTSLPETPGVYIYRNDKNRVLYVGKAINLKNRVSSYFQKTELLGSKTKALVDHIVKIDHIKVQNEIEALLLEADLIKRYRPPYNIELKDDKYYKYIVIEKKDRVGRKKNDNEDKLNIPQPEDAWTISTSRKEEDNTTQNEYFGPFPDGGSVSIILKSLRKVFPYRDCSNAKFTRYKKAGRPCLYGHIGVCPAPCQSVLAIQTNNDNIKKFKEYLKGDRKKLFQAIEREMKILSKNHEFEKAAQLRDQLISYQYLTQEKRNIREYIETPTLIDDEGIASLTDLITRLNEVYARLNLPQIHINHDELSNFRIEIFDISNFQGSNAVGSMTVLIGGISAKGEYRKFKIKTKDTPDDFAMMQEMLTRRFSESNIKKWGTPNLIVIDGGKGQLSSAIEVLNETEPFARSNPCHIIGLAKKFEEIVIQKASKDFEVIDIPNNTKAIRLLQKGRDEAHRFGITYYRKLHRKSIFEK